MVCIIHGWNMKKFSGKVCEYYISGYNNVIPITSKKFDVKSSKKAMNDIS